MSHWPWGIIVPIGPDPPPEFLICVRVMIKSCQVELFHMWRPAPPQVCLESSALYSGAVPGAEFILKNGATESQITTGVAPSWCWSEFRALCPTASIALPHATGWACLLLCSFCSIQDSSLYFLCLLCPGSTSPGSPNSFENSMGRREDNHARKLSFW